MQHTDARLTSAAGAGLVIIAAGLWATVGVAVQLVPEVDHAPPEILGLARTMLAGPLILFLAALGRRAVLRPLMGLHPGRLMELSVAGVVFQICLFRAFDLLGVTLTVVLTVCLPPLMAVAWSLRKGAAPGPGALGALGLAVAGLGLCSAEGLFGRAGSADLAGLCLAVLGSAAFVWMSDAARDLSRTAAPMVVAGAGLSLSGLIFCVVTPLVLPDPLPMLANLSHSAGFWGLIFYLALVPTALAYVTYCAGMARCQSTAVGLTASMIEPAIAALLAMAVLDETLTPAQLAGSGLMALAMVLLVRAETPAQAMRRSPSP